MKTIRLWIAFGAWGALVPGLAAGPALRLDAAAYDLGSGVLQFAFTFSNPGDSAMYLDCELPPRAVLEGSTLILVFDRRAGAAEGVAAGGPVPPDSGAARAFDPKAYPPQRIGGGHTFRGQRRLDRILGESGPRPRFTRLRVAMAYFPERPLGEEGGPYRKEAGTMAEAVHAVARKGRPPAPPKPVRIYRPEP
jgi:hypothetical protein